MLSFNSHGSLYVPFGQGSEEGMVGYNSDTDPILDDEGIRSLSEDFNLPYIELEYALKGERESTAMELLRWIDREEWRLREKHGLKEGRKLYKPVKLLKDIAKESGIGRYGQ